MGQIFAAIISPAVGVIISPFPIVGLILILLSDKARSNSISYTVGWIVGNAVAFLVALLLVGLGVSTAGGPGIVARVISFVLGALMIVIGIREFAKRPRKGEKPQEPKWFQKMSRIDFKGAAGFGFFLSALNPKNLVLSLSAGAAVGALGLSGGDQALTTVVYALLASASIIVLAVAFLLAGHRLDKALDELRDWLIQYNAVIMAVLLVVIGVNILSKAFQ